MEKTRLKSRASNRFSLEDELEEWLAKPWTISKKQQRTVGLENYTNTKAAAEEGY